MRLEVFDLDFRVVLRRYVVGFVALHNGKFVLSRRKNGVRQDVRRSAKRLINGLRLRTYQDKIDVGDGIPVLKTGKETRETLALLKYRLLIVCKMVFGVYCLTSSTRMKNG